MSAAPPTFHVKTSYGPNSYPAPHIPVLLQVDKCTLSHLTGPAGHVGSAGEFWAWHAQAMQQGHVRADTATAAFEQVLTGARNGRRESLHRAFALHTKYSALLMRRPAASLERVEKGKQPKSWHVVPRIAALSCAFAEIGWLRAKSDGGLLRRDLCARNIKEFTSWRDTVLPAWPRQASTALAIASIYGNQDAVAALKLKSSKFNAVRNGAFDALHLDGFITLCSAEHLMPSGEPPRIAVFVTADGDLSGAIDSFKLERTRSGEFGTALTFRRPWSVGSIPDQASMDWLSAGPPAPMLVSMRGHALRGFSVAREVFGGRLPDAVQEVSDSFDRYLRWPDRYF